MTCTNPEACQCTFNKSFMRRFCEHWTNPDRPLGDVDRANIDNFNRLPADVRHKCLVRLGKGLQETDAKTVDLWRDQANRGMAIGSEQLCFHFAAGMQIRNALREVVKDDELPPVMQVDGIPESNWDDYYYGALHAAVTEWPK